MHIFWTYPDNVFLTLFLRSFFVINTLTPTNQISFENVLLFFRSFKYWKKQAHNKITGLAQVSLINCPVVCKYALVKQHTNNKL